MQVPLPLRVAAARGGVPLLVAPAGGAAPGEPVRLLRAVLALVVPLLPGGDRAPVAPVEQDLVAAVEGPVGAAAHHQGDLGAGAQQPECARIDRFRLMVRERLPPRRDAVHAVGRHEELDPRLRRVVPALGRGRTRRRTRSRPGGWGRVDEGRAQQIPVRIGERRGPVGPPADEGHIHYQPAVHADLPGSRIHLPREQPQPMGGCSAQPAERLGVGEGRHLARVQYHGLAVRGHRLPAWVVLVRLGDHGQPQAGAGRGRHQGRHVRQVDPSRTGRPGQSRRADAPASRAGPVLHLEDEAQPPGVRVDEAQPGG